MCCSYCVRLTAHFSPPHHHHPPPFQFRLLRRLDARRCGFGLRLVTVLSPAGVDDLIANTGVYALRDTKAVRCRHVTRHSIMHLITFQILERRKPAAVSISSSSSSSSSSTAATSTAAPTSRRATSAALSHPPSSPPLQPSSSLSHPVSFLQITPVNRHVAPASVAPHSSTSLAKPPPSTASSPVAAPHRPSSSGTHPSSDSTPTLCNANHHQQPSRSAFDGDGISCSRWGS